MTKKVFELDYNINQSDRSLYSMLTDAFVGFFWDTGCISSKDLVPKTFASEPHGGILTQSWLVLIRAFQDSSNIKELCIKAKLLKKSEEITESIAGYTLLWAISNHNSTRHRRKIISNIEANMLNELLKD